MDASFAYNEVDYIRSVLEDGQFLDECCRQLSRSRAEIEVRIQTALSESLIGLQLLKDIELTGKRVLEIGAGIGIVSLALHRSGIDVLAIEPSLGGFDQNALIGTRLREWVGGATLPYLPLRASDLRPEIHGLFDVQFSVNVLEHIPDLEAAVAAMCRVLGSTGIMRHTCPNYLVPYEPHFGIPLVPLVPRLTGWIIPGIRGTELWHSLNFVSVARMRRAFRRNGYSCRFARGTMRAAFDRLKYDKHFRERQGASRLVSSVHILLRRLGLLELVGMLPPAFATPMTFEVAAASDNSGE